MDGPPSVFIVIKLLLMQYELVLESPHPIPVHVSAYVDTVQAVPTIVVIRGCSNSDLTGGNGVDGS